MQPVDVPEIREFAFAPEDHQVEILQRDTVSTALLHHVICVYPTVSPVFAAAIQHPNVTPDAITIAFYKVARLKGKTGRRIAAMLNSQRNVNR